MEKELKVLILEDVPTDAALMEHELKKGELSYESTRVDTKEDFICQLEEFDPDLILSDYSLPQFTGMDALLIAKEHSPYTPFIVVTGSINEETAVDCIMAGAWDYVTKEHLARLAPAIKGVMERKKEREEKNRADQKLKQLNIDLAAKIQELEQVLYVTSHDLRSPLVNIQGYTDEIIYSIEKLKNYFDKMEVPSEIRDEINEIIDDDIPESKKFILAGITKMHALIGGLLKLSRLGRVEIELLQLDMNRLIKDVVSNFKFKFKKENIKLEISDLPPGIGDYAQINMVFSNLIDNALKFLDPERPGHIRISGYEDNDKSVYCIEDNGIGIAPEYKDKIFEIFRQLTPSVEGEGLGLSIVRMILEKNEGLIRVESENGMGSKFFVTLNREKLSA
jgi:signal transduction histidine kinase